MRDVERDHTVSSNRSSIAIRVIIDDRAHTTSHFSVTVSSFFFVSSSVSLFLTPYRFHGLSPDCALARSTCTAASRDHAVTYSHGYDCYNKKHHLSLSLSLCVCRLVSSPPPFMLFFCFRLCATLRFFTAVPTLNVLSLSVSLLLWCGC